MPSVKDVLDKLRSKANPEQLKGMAKYGMVTEQRPGVSVPHMRKLAKELGKDHDLALELWRTRIAEARILAAMIDDPAKLTEEQMEDWVKDINALVKCHQNSTRHSMSCAAKAQASSLPCEWKKSSLMACSRWCFLYTQSA